MSSLQPAFAQHMNAWEADAIGLPYLGALMPFDYHDALVLGPAPGL